jgi:tetratricopeptide (TPR) repeat protein
MAAQQAGGSPAQAAVERGLALLDVGDAHAALAQFEAATDLDLNHLEAYGWMAAALAKLGRFDEAHRSADHALWLDQFSPWAWNRKGAVFVEARDFRMALQCFRRAVELDPSFEAARENARRVEPLAGVNAQLEGADEASPANRWGK